MSFMGSAIKTYKDVTLPSVEAGLGTLNIVKDPPKAVYTRKIDKVGEDSTITDMIDGSGDRMSQGVNLYARGVNPMVTVAYSNYGNNGGMQPLQRSMAGAATLPYKVMDKGAFRPPLINPRDLLPLSRQPRLVTQALTNPSAVNYTQKQMCPESNTMKQIKQSSLARMNVRPTAIYNVERSIKDINPQDYVIENPIKISGYSGTKTQEKQTRSHLKPKRGVRDELTYVVATTNPGTERTSKKIDLTLHTDKYLTDGLTKTVVTNPGQKIDKNKYALENVALIKNLPSYQMLTNPGKKIDKNKYTANNVELSKNVPKYSMMTNPGGMMGETNTSSRSTQLKEKRRPDGGVVAAGMIPGKIKRNLKTRTNEGECQKRKDIYSEQVSRYSI